MWAQAVPRVKQVEGPRRRRNERAAALACASVRQLEEHADNPSAPAQEGPHAVESIAFRAFDVQLDVHRMSEGRW